MSAGLGETPLEDLERVRLTVPLPSTREALVAAFKAIVEQGRVQRVEVRVGQPIVYERMVPRELVPDGDVLPALEADLYAEVRNNPMEELFFPDASLFIVLFRAFAYLAEKKLSAKGFLVHDQATLRAALGDVAYLKLDTLYGVPVSFDKRLPETSLVLAAGPAHDDSVSFSLRLELPARRKA